MRFSILLFSLAVLGCEAQPERTEATPRPTPPTATQRAFAIGPFVEPVPTPRGSDWLANHKQSGQTFEEWQAADKNVVEPTRRVIYLQPLGDFSGPRAMPLEELRQFTAAYFQLPVVVRPSMPLDFVEPRKGFEFGPQYWTDPILDRLVKELPADAFCMLGVTMSDLYPDPEWGFAFGAAYLSQRTGVFSFARYSPPGADSLDEKEQRQLTRRAFKVLSHEIGHMFGIEHCTAHRCRMNGSNTLSEMDRQTMMLCPVCLKKLHASAGFDVVARDRAIITRLDDAGLTPDADRYRTRLEWVTRD